jgi:hypothetical protein
LRLASRAVIFEAVLKLGRVVFSVLMKHPRDANHAHRGFDLSKVSP